MNLFHATIFGFTAWRICSAAALLLLYALLKIRWARAEAQQPSGNPENKKNNYNEPNSVPTLTSRTNKSALDLTDTQRIDHLHRLVSLKAGEQADLKDLTFGRLPQFRIAFAGIEEESGRDFAHLKVELGGATADYGTSVHELGENDFLVPRATPGDQHCSIHYTCGKSDAVSFLQLKVSQLNAAEQSAAIDVLHVRGRRAA